MRKKIEQTVMRKKIEQTVMVEKVIETTNNELDTIRSEYNKFTTTSAKIRYLNDLGWTRGKISKELKIIYQHVRNVLITPIKKPKES